MTTRNVYLILMTGLLLFASCNGQTKYKNKLDNSTKTQIDNYELTPETAHPKAKKLMTEEFYWSPIEESGPFGSDDGSDAFYGFRQWRQSNQSISPVVYLKELIEGWGYPPFDFNEMNEANLKKYISSSQIGSMTLTGQDNAITAVGFGQFVLEGKIDDDIKALTKTALNRELLPSILGMWEGEYKKTRTEQLLNLVTTDNNELRPFYRWILNKQFKFKMELKQKIQEFQQEVMLKNFQMNSLNIWNSINLEKNMILRLTQLHIVVIIYPMITKNLNKFEKI